MSNSSRQIKLSEAGRATLKQLEGVRTNFYTDCKNGMCGKAIGIGFNCNNHEDICNKAAKMMEQNGGDLKNWQVDQLFDEILPRFETPLRKKMPNIEHLGQEGVDAFIMHAYQRGPGNTIRLFGDAMQRGDFRAIPDLIRNDGAKGLGGESNTRRRNIEADHFMKMFEPQQSASGGPELHTQQTSLPHPQSGAHNSPPPKGPRGNYLSHLPGFAGAAGNVVTCFQGGNYFAGTWNAGALMWSTAVLVASGGWCGIVIKAPPELDGPPAVSLSICGIYP
ncbi:hypothetical protein K432DRAFT_408827 [Lepidopterella palustris CBS 459.81]|uniref:Lysozyme n=1 Tax=Lepidopterella palustris CBS 459.81 TaxID=1314670 RepID=A0A8E2JAP6_9PEZI|nr:hypothetical protein K432DRAFT_408827 [Lepidopterella palustris CBS 459.81]